MSKDDTGRKNALRVLGSVLHNPINRERIERMIYERANETIGFESTGDTLDVKVSSHPYYRYLVYEITDALLHASLSDSPAEAAMRVFRDLRAGRHGSRHTRFEYISRIFEEEENFLCNPPDIDEGVIACSKCGSNKTYSFTKQVRRADESATVFVTCSKCRHSFRIG
jgi:DNA-directed RNA polymerase subunit M/transcription elongation factor TFIIS